MRRVLPMFGFLLLSTGCPGFGGPPDEIDEAPTWDNSVAALMMTNCAVCHTNPPVAGAPNGFRFDKYTTADIDDGGLLGAFEMTARIKVRAVDTGTMPPGGGLSGNNKLVLDEWVSTGAPRAMPAVTP